jgi:hypothetical protein
LVLASFGFLACTITQEVEPLARTPTPEVCIIEDPDVREGFLAEYTATLRARGYDVRVLPSGASLDACTVTSTYTARWSWDITIYMSYAQIKVFVDGQLAGQALYDARRGSANTDKFIDAEPKIRELVSELFPARSEPPPAA